MPLLLLPLFTDHSLSSWSFSAQNLLILSLPSVPHGLLPTFKTGFKLLPVWSVPGCLQSALPSLCPHPHPFLIHHIYPATLDCLRCLTRVHTPSSVPFCAPVPLPKMSSSPPPPPPPLQKSIPPCFIAFYLLTFPDLQIFRMNSSFLIPWRFTYHNTCHSQSLISVLSF